MFDPTCLTPAGKIKHGKQFLIFLVIVSTCFFMVACATHTSQYKPIEKALLEEKYDKAVELLKQSKENGDYTEKDRVLYSMESGLAHHYATNREESNERLSRAETYIDELYTKSISKTGFSYLTNNTQLPYRGEAYEDLYANVFKALNYAEMDETDGAFVEIRKLDEKLSQLEDRYKRLADHYQESSVEDLGDTEDLADTQTQFKPGETKFHSSALGRYLGYIMYLHEHDLDDARIDFEKMQEAFNNQPAIYNFDFPKLPREPVTSPDRSRVYVFAMLGRGPIKTQETARIYYRGNYIKWAYPELEKRGTAIKRVEIVGDEVDGTELNKIEDINNVAYHVFKPKEGIIKTQNFVRTLVKSITMKNTREAVDAGVLGAVATVATQEITENADLRTTRLLPGEVHVGSVVLPTDQTHTVNVKYYGSNDKPVSEKSIEITPQNDSLNILELNNFH